MTTVLVVEDEAFIAEDLQQTLLRLGYDAPLSAATGRDAIRAADELRPAIVLMDIELRGAMDGIEAAAEIRRRSDARIVYLTAHGDEETLARALRTEPAGYLLKPFTERALRAAVEIAARRASHSDTLGTLSHVSSLLGHKLNNPLAAVLASAWFGAEVASEVDETLRTANEEDPARTRSVIDTARRRLADLLDALRDVSAGGERMRDIVEQLRRIGVARHVTRRPVDLACAVEQATHIVHADGRRLAKTSSPLPLVMGHESELAHAIACVLENALEASAARETIVRISTGTDADGRAFVEISDSGEGIAEENLARVFDPFFTTRGATGSRLGVGLTIAQHVVTEAGGEITIDSAPLRGTTVRIALPAA